jgi:hypothetical protein
VSMSEPVYFQCPACGVSFEVRSAFSERIYCGHECRRISHNVLAGINVLDPELVIAERKRRASEASA